MSDALIIAESVWRKILTMKVIYFLVFCAILEISITGLYEVLMANEERMLMVDTSILLTFISGLLCVLALSFDIPKDVVAEGTLELEAD